MSSDDLTPPPPVPAPHMATVAAPAAPLAHAALLDPLPGILNLGFLNLLAGASGIGKTAFIAAAARAFRDGAPFLGHATHQPQALAYVTADRPWADSRLWFDAVGFSDIAQYSIVDDHTLLMSRFRRRADRTQLLLHCLDKLHLPPGGLVFVDPIALFLGGNLLDYDTVAIACIEIHRVLQARRLCAVGLMHASKQKGDPKERYTRVQDRILGSSALLGFTGTQMYLMSPEESGGDYFSFMWNPHHRPAESFELRKDERGLFHQVEDQDRERPALESLGAEVVALYKQFPEPPAALSIKELVTLFADTSRATLFRRLKTLADAKYIIQAKYGAWKRRE